VLVKWLQGYAEQAQRLEGDAIALAKEYDDLFSPGYARSIGAIVSEMCGHDAESESRAQSALDPSVAKEFALWIARPDGSAGIGCCSRKRDADASLEKIRDSVGAVPALGVRAALRFVAGNGLPEGRADRRGIESPR